MSSPKLKPSAVGTFSQAVAGAKVEQLNGGAEKVSPAKQSPLRTRSKFATSPLVCSKLTVGGARAHAKTDSEPARDGSASPDKMQGLRIKVVKCQDQRGDQSEALTFGTATEEKGATEQKLQPLLCLRNSFLRLHEMGGIQKIKEEDEDKLPSTWRSPRADGATSGEAATEQSASKEMDRKASDSSSSDGSSVFSE